jgi:post-segregation antitoxin (ccd killing protein)
VNIIYYVERDSVVVFEVNGSGEEFVRTSIRIPRDLHDAARSRGLNISQMATAALADIVGKSPGV